SAKIGVHYTGGNLTAAGGKSPYTYSIKAGSTLPGNLTLTTSGKIVGTPTTAGTYTFTLIVKDSQSPQQSSERVFNLVVRSDDTDMVTVLGGISAEGTNFSGQPVQTFQMGRFEVTWEEWQKVRTYAIPRFYDLTAIGTGAAATHPVVNVSWHDVVKWCNAKSEMDGLTPVYTVNGTVYKTGQSVPSIDASANGYRLPSEREWEWAARGGGLNNGCVYSGSNTANDVAWTYENSSDGTKAVGTKAANELGIYDMSGNVWEWCWDVLYDYYGTSYRRIRGGGWNSYADAAVAGRGNNGDYPVYRSNGFGFRLARSSGN
ncbi:MAG: SUMF1/EgtB/PvdO family nonheme iron enzyme, partial [Verrucomicrobia bacterium]|nr:SUMF1/EgtB/PvdO family nonheme iron enzyme [Verrucomicrobiota bacterium]